MSDVQIGGQQPDNLYADHKRRPRSCRGETIGQSCVHYRFGTCGSCPSRSRRLEELREEKLNA